MEKKKLMSLMRKAKEESKFQPTIHAKLAKQVKDGVMCILCKVNVKSNNEWISHCSSDKHKESLLAIRNKKIQNEENASKRSFNDRDESDEVEYKRMKYTETENETTDQEDEDIYDETFLREYLEFESTLSENNNETEGIELTKSIPLPDVSEYMKSTDLDDVSYESTTDTSLIFSQEGMDKKALLSKIDEIKKVSQFVDVNVAPTSDTVEEEDEESGDESLEDILGDGWRKKHI